jgi:hypothetical protein
MKASKLHHLCIFSILFITGLCSSQNGETTGTTPMKTMHSVTEYPTGFYYTYQDFLDKKVRPCITIVRRSMLGNHVLTKDATVDQVFFYSVHDTTKVTNIFAISYEGNLYFGQKFITKYAKKGNKNEEGDNPNSYHRVIKEGKFFYMEGPFANGWAKGLAYGSGGAVGGTIGANLNRLKGVIFDFDMNKFDYIKNCKDFILFLEEYHSDTKVDCDTYDILKVREIIDQLIK